MWKVLKIRGRHSLNIDMYSRIVYNMIHQKVNNVVRLRDQF